MAFKEINYEDLSGKINHTKISGYPDRCPGCRKGIGPRYISAYETVEKWCKNIFIVFQCPLVDCKSIFVGYYSANEPLAQYFVLKRNYIPFLTEPLSLPESIEKISPKFPRIYWQATASEENGLDEVCGSGYRRALEFLIKDYLIAESSDPDSEAKTIEESSLGQCIKKIPDERIQAVAQRAAWLGNDETHFVRKWEDMDLKNLKQLIQLTIYWIDATISTSDYLKQMPE